MTSNNRLASIIRAPARLLILLVVVSTTACSEFSAPMDPAVKARLNRRLTQRDGMALHQITSSQPRTVDEDLPRFMQARAAASAPTEGLLHLTIADVRAAALANNLNIQVAVTDPKIAGTAVSEERAKFDQLIFVNASYGRNDLPERDGDLVKFSGLKRDSKVDGELVKLTRVEQQQELASFEPGIRVPLPTGGQLTVSAPLAQKSIDDPATFDEYFSAMKFSLSQPLLRGAGVDVNVASIRMARYEAGAVDARTRLNAIRVLANADRAFWQLYGSWRQLDVRRIQYQVARDNLELVRTGVNEGLTRRVEIVRAELGVAERLEALAIAETSLRLRERELRQLMNAPDLSLDHSARLITQTDPTLLGFTFDRKALVAGALDNRLEMLEIEMKLASDAVRIDYQRNQTLPLFSVGYDYSFLGRDASFDSAFKSALDGEKHEFAVRLMAEIPITNEQRRSQLRRAILTRTQRLASQREKRQQIEREVLDSLDQLDQNWNRILAARQNVIAAGVNYELELAQFREGLRTMTEVFEALTRLGEAQSREIRAIVDYQIAQIDLAYATGTLLGYSNVDLNARINNASANR